MPAIGKPARHDMKLSTSHHESFAPCATRLSRYGEWRSREKVSKKRRRILYLQKGTTTITRTSARANAKTYETPHFMSISSHNKSNLDMLTHMLHKHYTSLFILLTLQLCTRITTILLRSLGQPSQELRQPIGSRIRHILVA